MNTVAIIGALYDHDALYVDRVSIFFQLDG